MKAVLKKKDKQEKGNRNQIFSIKYKIMIPVAVIVIILASVMGISFSSQMEKELLDMAERQAAAAVKVAALNIDGEQIGSLNFSKGLGVTDSIIVNTIKSELKSVSEACNVRFIYTLYTDGEKVYYGIDATTGAEASKPGSEYENTYEDIKAAFEGSSYSDNEIDYTEYGPLMSAYYPITDDTGNVVAVVGGDYDAADIIAQLGKIKTEIVLIVIFGVILAIIILNFIVGRIIKNIRLVNDKIFDLVHNEGDLTQTLDVKTNDEMELMANNLNSLLGHIREVMLNVAGGSNSLNGSSRQVADNLIRANDNISDVSATMEQMSAAMQETSASLMQIDTAISDAYKRIGSISKTAADGNDFAVGISQKAEEINISATEVQNKASQMTKDIAESMNDKIQKSRQVEEINVLTENILTITEETSLLALNASIEAARAGEAGRGFAVVATEISKLAADSALAAEQIQTVSEQVIDAVHALSEEAEVLIKFLEKDGMEGYAKLLQTSKDYSADADAIRDTMREFAAESETLEEAMNTVKEALGAVAIAVEESAKGVVSVSETSAELSESMRDIGGQANNNLGISESLNEEINKFKL